MSIVLDWKGVLSSLDGREAIHINVKKMNTGMRGKSCVCTKTKGGGWTKRKDTKGKTYSTSSHNPFNFDCTGVTFICCIPHVFLFIIIPGFILHWNGI